MGCTAGCAGPVGRAAHWLRRGAVLSVTTLPPSKTRGRKHGPVVIPPEVIERAAARWELDPASGCHISAYSAASHGYAQIGWHDRALGRSRMTLCHRAVWIGTYGPIADGMTIDHMCRVRKCVNLAHLRLLPNLENARRTSGPDWPVDGRCRHGHDASFWRAKSPTLAKGYCSACTSAARRRKR